MVSSSFRLRRAAASQKLHWPKAKGRATTMLASSWGHKEDDTQPKAHMKKGQSKWCQYLQRLCLAVSRTDSPHMLLEYSYCLGSIKRCFLPWCLPSFFPSMPKETAACSAEYVYTAVLSWERMYAHVSVCSCRGPAIPLGPVCLHLSVLPPHRLPW